MSSHGTFQFEVWTFLEVLTVQAEKKPKRTTTAPQSLLKFQVVCTKKEKCKSEANKQLKNIETSRKKMKKKAEVHTTRTS